MGGQYKDRVEQGLFGVADDFLDPAQVFRGILEHLVQFAGFFPHAQQKTQCFWEKYADSARRRRKNWPRFESVP